MIQVPTGLSVEASVTADRLPVLTPAPFSPPPRRSTTPHGRLVLGAVAVVVVQLAAIAFVGNVIRSSPILYIRIDWQAGVVGCGLNTSVSGVENYTIYYDNHYGPSGYAVMAIGLYGRLARFWSVYVPSGTFQLEENGSIPIRCSGVNTFHILLFDTIPS